MQIKCVGYAKYAIIQNTQNTQTCKMKNVIYRKICNPKRKWEAFSFQCAFLWQCFVWLLHKVVLSSKHIRQTIWNLFVTLISVFFQPNFEKRCPKKKSKRQNHFANLCKICSQTFEQKLNIQDQQNQLLIFGGMLVRKWQPRLLNSKPRANLLYTHET